MVCMKSEGRTALTALAPEAHFLAAGTMSGAVGQPSAPLATMKIYSLHFHSDTPAVQLLAAAPSPHRFNRLCWSRPAAAEGPSFSLGLIAGGLGDGSVAVWSPLHMISSEGEAEDAMVARLEKYKGAVSGLQFSPREPNRLASANVDGDIYIWDLKYPLEPEVKNVGFSAQTEITCLAWNPMLNYLLASTSSDGITVWDLRSNKSLTRFLDPNRRRCSVLQWNPEVPYQLIAASDDDNSPSLRVWDTREPTEPVRELTGHSKGVIAMSWCPYDTSFLVSSGKDNRTICWDTVRGEIISEQPTSSENNFNIYWYRESPVIVAVSSVDGNIGVHNLEFSGIYGAGDTACPRAPAPKWLKCPTQASTTEVHVHVHNLVKVSGEGKGQQLPEQICTSSDTMEVGCAKAFVEKYYLTFNKRPDRLHELYSMGSTVNWPNSDGEMKTISGAKALKNLFASKSEVCKDFVLSTIVVHTGQNVGLLAVTNGRFTNADGRLSKFSQSFLLTNGRNGDFAVLNDVMTFHGFHQNVCVIYDDEMTKHCGNDDEQPTRISSIMGKFSDCGLLQRVVVERAGPVKDKEMVAAHEPDYLDFIKDIKDLPLSAKKKKDYKKFFNDVNISFSDGTLTAILLAAGAVLKACKLVATGRYDHAFAVVRPPGHHATANYADGFCFLNNIAIGAKELLRSDDIKKIIIVDIDVHHGDGTQSIFFDDSRVLFFSTHKGAKRFFPFSGSGNQENIGTGGGMGHNINVCLPDEFEDDDLLVAIQYVLLPVAKSFCPDIILVSAGYDAAGGDPLGLCNLTPPCYGTIINMLKKIPSKRGLVLALEGGYELDALAQSATSSLKSLLGDQDDLLTHEHYRPHKDTWDAVTESRKILSPYWHVLLAKIPQEVLDRYRVKPGRRHSGPLSLGRRAREKDPGKSKASQLRD